MAQKLETFEFKTRNGRTTKYPWEEWLDGSIWRIEGGKDYELEDEAMQRSIRGGARRRDKKVRVNADGEGAIVFQAVEE